MATDIETHKPISDNAVASEGSIEFNSIQRGSQLLRMLQQAAQAARLEAQVSQLSTALREAQHGLPERLHVWLERYQAGELDDVFAADLNSSDLKSSADGFTSRESSHGAVRVNSHKHDCVDAVDGWEHYLQCARQRLALRKSLCEQHVDNARFELKSLASTMPQLDRHPLPQQSSAIAAGLDDSLPEDFSIHVAPQPAWTEDNVAGAVSTVAETDEDADVEAADRLDEAWRHDHWRSEPGIDQSVTSTVDGELELNEPELNEPELSELALCTSDQSHGTTQEPTVTGRRLGSMGFSLIGHAILLLALGMMTYRAPSDAAALGSQVMSAESASDNVEAGQEFELPEPLTLELPESSASSSMEKVPTDLSQLDQQLAAPRDASTLSMQPAMSSAASTLNAAVAAAAASGGSGGSGAAAGRGGGGPPTAGGKFFGVATGGNYFCYVVDSSGSMRGGAWESAKVELLRSLSSLKSTQRFYIIFFAREIHAIPEPGSREVAPYGLTATPENIDHARRWIDTVRLDRGGPPNDALELAIDREPDAIYLLTDGVTSVDVCGFLREKNRVTDIIDGTHVRVPIHSIAYYSLDGQQLLRQIAQENDGQFHYVPKR